MDNSVFPPARGQMDKKRHTIIRNTHDIVYNIEYTDFCTQNIIYNIFIFNPMYNLTNITK